MLSVFIFYQSDNQTFKMSRTYISRNQMVPNK